MLDVDLTIPIVILGVTVALVFAFRAWLALEDRRVEQRTATLIRDLQRDAPEVDDETRRPRDDDGDETS